MAVWAPLGLDSLIVERIGTSGFGEAVGVWNGADRNGQDRLGPV